MTGPGYPKLLIARSNVANVNHSLSGKKDICSARMRNLDGYVTGHPLRNRSSGYITGRPDALPMYNASRLRNRLARCITSVFGYVTGRPVAEPYT